MKKRFALICLLASLMPIVQILMIRTGFYLTSTVIMIALPLKVNAESAQFYLKRADEKFSRKDYYAAISDYTRVIEMGYARSYPIRRRGRSKYYLGDLSGALSDFNQAILNEPLIRFNYQFRGDAKADMGDNYGAISDYKRAIEIDPNDPYSYIFSGYAKLNLKDINGACLDWRIAKNKDIKNNFQSPGLMLSRYCINLNTK